MENQEHKEQVVGNIENIIPAEETNVQNVENKESKNKNFIIY